ncbi:MAG: ISL3 family transposase [Spirochaetia bacterium]|nr:ISL3 family transposase [Spirochaetia bacterium]
MGFQSVIVIKPIKAKQERKPMTDYTNTSLELPYFETTKFPKKEIKNEPDGSWYKVETMYGRITTEKPTACPHCNEAHSVEINQHLFATLKHLYLGNVLLCIHIEYLQYWCTQCSRTCIQEIPFKQKEHFITKAYYNQIVGLLGKSKASIAGIAASLKTSWKIVKNIDKKQLKEKYPDLKPTHYSPYIAVDEFSLHKGHRYATVVIDWQTGEILFLEEGNREEQLHHFFDHVGRDWMKHVKAISMDMNAQYNKAIKTRYPHIKIIYDGFHIIRNFNDRIITELRRLEQNRLKEQEDEIRQSIKKTRKVCTPLQVGSEKKKELLQQLHEDYQALNLIRNDYTKLKHSRFHLLSSREGLRKKDEVAREHNRELNEKYEKKGLSLPPGERKWSIFNEKKLDTVLTSNEHLNIAFFLGDQLKGALQTRNIEDLKSGMDQWLALSKKYEVKIPMLKSFNKMLTTRMDGILSRAVYPISNGPLEGVNHMIKTTRRAAYGYRDQEYFFLKIWDNSRIYIKSRRIA